MIFLQIIISAVCTGGLYGLFASGFSFQLSALKTVDVSYGSWLMVAMYLTFTLYKILRFPFYLTVACIMVTFFFVGYAMRRFIIARCKTHMVQLIATMAMTFIIQNIAEFFYEATPRATGMLEYVYMMPIFGGEIPVSMTRLGMFILALAVLLGFQLFLTYTWTGNSIRAMVQEGEAAQLSGVNVERVMNVAYGVSYVLAAVAGCMLAVFIPITPFSGSYYQTLSFIICVAAGKASMRGVLYIGIIIGVMEAILQFITPALKER
jgi:branched-chain amino acid transport system permease protein